MQPEGVIKFEAIWRQTPPLPANQLRELIHWRQTMYHAGLIGQDEQGIGYGNISQRIQPVESFVISGSGTGRLAAVGPEHFCTVEKVELHRNRLWCSGPVIASSESMSHAAVYQGWQEAKGVVHVHHETLWQSLLTRYPTTDPTAAYGTVAMAASIETLVNLPQTQRLGVIVMAGHRPGLLAFGQTLAQACQTLLDLLESQGI